MLGRRRDQIARASLSPEQWREHAAALVERRPFRDLVCRAAIADGSVRWLRVNGHPLFAPNGDFLGYRGATRDITAEVVAQAALKTSEERLEALVEVSPDWVYEMGADLRFTYFSPNVAKTLGIAPDYFIGRLSSEVGPVESAQEGWQRYIEALSAGKPVRGFVFKRTLPDGRSVWIKTSSTPLFDDAGNFIGHRGVSRDVTAEIEIERTERALRRFHEAIAEMPHPFVMFDEDERLVAYNRAFADLHQRPDGSCILRKGMSFDEIAQWRIEVGFYGDASDGGVADKESLLRDVARKGEVAYRLRDGKWILVDRHALRDGGSVGMWTDITAIKRADAERRALAEQLHHSNKLEALGTLAGGIAHDVNNALVPVIAMTKRALTVLPPDDPVRRSLELVLKGGERAKELVQQVLAFSRKEKSVKRPFDLAQVVVDALKLLRASIPSTISLESVVEPVPLIAGDPGQWHQVVFNLVTNAAHAIGHEIGAITLRLRHLAEDNTIRLVVADTGCGMDEATRQRVFEPFFTTKAVGKGTGLGLSVVHGIVADHGGTITVESAPGRGAAFEVVLPAGLEAPLPLAGEGGTRCEASGG